MEVKRTERIIGTAIISGLILILQLASRYMKIGEFSITLVLVPIVVGAIMYGRISGAVLGGVFGAAVLFSGDAAAFWDIDPFYTLVTVMSKGILAGLASGVVYHVLKDRNEWISAGLASIVCPVVNTGVFFIGGMLFFSDSLSIAAEAGGKSLPVFMITDLAGINFLIEFGINLVLSLVIQKLIKLIREELIMQK